jgi:hypothetical protein
MCPPADPTSTPFPRVKEATTMVVVGADVHKFKHTFVAVDEVGRKLGEKTVKATTDGHITAIMWAPNCFGVSRTAATCQRGSNVTCWLRDRK